MSITDCAIYIKTIFCDIDGCIFMHHGGIVEILSNASELLPGVKEKFKQWGDKGYTVILVTGRPESSRVFTEQQIHDAGLYYHHLIMNLPRGQRVIINDIKPDQTIKIAECINIERNEGMKNVNI